MCRLLLLLLISLTVSKFSYGQNENLQNQRSADSLLERNHILDAYKIFKNIELSCDKNDTLYPLFLWNLITATIQLEQQSRMDEQFDKSLQYGLEVLQLIEKGESYFDENFINKKYWTYKNIIVSYFGLGQLENAQKYKDILYKAYKENKLPPGIDHYFNFTFYKWEDKNIWGYEWFEELPKDRFSTSFTKIVYYVYSTNPDGTDKDQLYRLHVLMFHNINPSNKIAYVLTKYLLNEKYEVSSTLYE